MKRILLIAALLMLCLSSLGSYSVSAVTPAWQAVAGPRGGSVTALVMSPNYASDQTVFAGLRGQGVYRSLGGGGTWQPSGLVDQVIVDLAISPNFTVDHTLFAAIGEGSGGYNIYRSTDGGMMWQTPYVTPYSDGFKKLIALSISPDYATDHTLYALGAAEMYKSTDGGLVFTKMGGWYATHNVTALVFSPAFAADHTVFAVVAGNGIMKSIDSGGAWQPTAFNASAYTALAVSPDYANDHTVAAIDGATGQLYLSLDGGAIMNSRDLLLGTGDKHTLLFSPTFAADRLVLAASSGDPGAYRSADGGDTWTPVGWYDPALPFRPYFARGTIQAFAIPPNTAPDGLTLAGTDSSLYLSRDRGQNWEQNNGSLPQLSLRAFAIAPDNPATVLAGASFYAYRHFTGTPRVEADGNLQLSTDNGDHWRDVSGPIDRVRRVAFSPDYANDHAAFACAGISGQDGYTGGGVYRSTNSALHWTALLSDVLCSDLALSPRYAIDHTAWAAIEGQGLRRTTNGGDSWDMLNDSFFATMLLPSPNYAIDHALFATTSDGHLHKSIDGGQNWAPVLSYTVTAMAVSPVYGASQTLFAGVKETQGSAGQLYRSGDGGAHWQKLTTTLPPMWSNQPSTISAIEFAKDGSLLVGLVYGSAADGAVVYRSVDAGQTWQAVNGGLGDSGLFAMASLSTAADSETRGTFKSVVGTLHALSQISQQQRDSTEPGAWDTTGPRGGRADVLALSPNFANDGVAFAGEWNWFRFSSQYGRGPLKSSDGGQTWQPAYDPAEGSPGSAVRGFAFSPNFATDRTVFFASWNGLFKSTDGGLHWQKLDGFEPNVFHPFAGISLAPNYPTSGHMLALGGYYGGCLYLSTDFGITWVYECASPYAATVAYSPDFAHDNTIFSAGNGVHRSGDGGLSWTPVLTAPVYNVIASPDYAHDQTVFATGEAFYLSHNKGATWISVTIGISTTAIGMPAISPAFATDHTLFVIANSHLYRSTNGGLNWTLMPGTPDIPLGPLAISPGWPTQLYLLIGTPEGVYRSTDGGATWARMPGLTTLSILALTRTGDEALWLTGSSNGMHASTDQGRTWEPFDFQEFSSPVTKVEISPDYANDHTLFNVTACADCMGNTIRRTTDGGATWDIVFSTDAIGSLAISPGYAADHTIIAGTYSRAVMGSLDGGDSWNPIGTWPPGVSNSKALAALPPSYPADSTIFAAGTGFWRLPPGQTVWQPAASGIVSTTDITALAVAPNYTQSQTLLAGTIGYEANSWYTRVLRSDDGGVSWQTSAVGLPPMADYRSFAFSPHYTNDHTVYVASSHQLYRSVNNGHQWTAVAPLPEDIWFNKIAVRPNGDVVVAASSGVWVYSTGFRDTLINGDAEAPSGWTFFGEGAGDAADLSYHAQHALRLGLANGLNQPIESTAIQTVTIPISVTLAQFNVRLYPASSEANLAPHAFDVPRVFDTPHSQSVITGDAQYIGLVLSGAETISPTLLWMLSNAQAWQRYSFDLTAYAGQTLQLRIGVHNDGQGGQTALYVDNAALITLSAPGSKVYLPVLLK
jgi:photosystem II stability/assembly factor-like uncharacterized protein